MTVTESSVPELVFPAGLPGFPQLRRFGLQRWGGEDSPYSLLVALEQPEVRFLVAPPEAFFDDYSVELDDDQAHGLGLVDEGDALVLVIVTLGDRPADATANLLGPIVVNLRTRTATQVVLADADHGTRVPLVPA